VTDWLQLLGCEVMFDERFGFSFMGKQSKIGWWRESLGGLLPLPGVCLRDCRLQAAFPVTGASPLAAAGVDGRARNGAPGRLAASAGSRRLRQLLAAGGLHGQARHSVRFPVA
jgi:hypothetical protein